MDRKNRACRKGNLNCLNCTIPSTPFFALSIIECYRSEEHTSELQSLMRTSYAVFCLKKKHTSARTEAHTSEQQYIIHISSSFFILTTTQSYNNDTPIIINTILNK